jgi:DNA-binding transcriptional MerR regulator
MLIGELLPAARGGTTAKTLCFYEVEGMRPPPARTTSGYRHYPAGRLPEWA